MTRTKKQSSEATVREIRSRTRRTFAPEEKIRIVLEGLRGEQSISEIGTNFNLDDKTVDGLIEVGGRLLRESPDFKDFLADLQ